MTHAERATAYARAVVAGDVVAGRLTVLACQRHLDDLAREWEYTYDLARANQVCRFIELLPHVKGKWLGSTIVLEDWQCFVVCVAFGWVDAAGKRRFRRAYWEICRKNAKSTLSAALGLYMFCEDSEGGSEVYSGATTEKQAWEVFGPARLMAKNTTELQDYYGVRVGAKNLYREAVNAKFEPVIGNPGDGASPHFAIIDEYHEHKDDRQYDTMDTGMGAREQPMIWTITTAGDDHAGPCYALRGELVAILEGTVVDERFCGAIWTIDKGDDWTDPASMEKGNPNLGVSVFRSYLEAQVQRALTNPRKQSAVKTKHFNVWVGSADPYFNTEKWLGQATELTEDDFVGEPCWIGCDVASKLDIACYGKLFARTEHGDTVWYWFPRFYLPEEQTSRHQHYQGWVIQGHLTATDGNIIDLDRIESDIMADAERFRVASFGYDPWNAQQLQEHLTKYGIECVEVHQTTPNLSNPMKWVQAEIEDGRLRHDGNPVMSWCIDNVTAREDMKENVFPRKAAPEKKIDGAVALIIARGRAFVPEATSSYLEADDYEEHFG